MSKKVAKKKAKKKESTVKVAGTLIHVALADLVGYPGNREVHTGLDVFVDLVDSIKVVGVLEPIHVRDCPDKKGKLQILAGHRRVEACKQAKLKDIQAINYGAIEDSAAAEIVYITNYAREDLTPLEEGKAVVMLLAAYNDDFEAVASKMGKSLGWVKLRQMIETNLDEQWRWMAESNPDCCKWTVSHFELIARLPKDTQVSILDSFHSYDLSVSDLRGDISGFLRLVKDAAWKKDCAGCLERSDRQQDLFGDFGDDEKSARCLDFKCWEEKKSQYLQEQIDKQKEKHPDLVFVSSDGLGYREKKALNEKHSKVLDYYEYNNAKKSDPEAKPAIVVNGKGLGSLRWITTRKTTAKKTGQQAGVPKSLKQRRAELKAKRWEQVVKDLRVEIVTLDVKALLDNDYKFAAELSAAVLLTICFGSEDNRQHLRRGTEKGNPWERLKLLAVSDCFDVPLMLWESVRPVLVNRLSYNGPITQTPDYLIKEAKTVAGLLGIDIDAMFEEVSGRKGFTEPKSWANLNADGTKKAG